MRRTSRLFELIQALRGALRPQTAAELAEKLEVCKRTIYRDVASLQAMGVPIQGEAGIGYVMRPGFDLPPLMLSVDEVEALVVALCLLQRTGDAGLKAAAETIQGKIQDVIPRSVSAPRSPIAFTQHHTGLVRLAMSMLQCFGKLSAKSKSYVSNTRIATV